MGDLTTYRETDRDLADYEEHALGADLVTPRIGFMQHEIYVGGVKVMHGGAVLGLCPGERWKRYLCRISAGRGWSPLITTYRDERERVRALASHAVAGS
jgi:hypothetical protein